MGSERPLWKEELYSSDSFGFDSLQFCHSANSPLFQQWLIARCHFSHPSVPSSPQYLPTRALSAPALGNPDLLPLWRFGGCFQLTHSFSKDNKPNESISAASCWASPAGQPEIRVFALRICSIGPFPLLRLGGSCSPPLFPALTLYYLVYRGPVQCQLMNVNLFSN